MINTFSTENNLSKLDKKDFQKTINGMYKDKEKYQNHPESKRTCSFSKIIKVQK